ncbi:hypothetical protein A2313_03260 [Candidatus Roizmanbacteria bacterium RIFOXYB2_FULL_41_10]|uniref:Excinuclease ABC subunit C n=1 Tax=Candidatus Roizmanbacteria bacterium RIFOXYA1_FULL_41_12 TaxID=1802082 RepID=A0A1F7K9V8_9BACT|nr:MAG: hypothetical protein A2262_02945 [Candidatus Roizmanbacteria bacterium RIFOXYA2_FULL_41_8]OGK64658.1 MAG: hypothetical protein A2209_03660 [Candidatus Roizmanbacteria bacterium RIFOXYA1_FULL_41_12]OGK67204.1 MAG: hypothetical protein A2377_01040 [Candidatus Roizmanbacteria bacterium RIFOXYB1_FULL_41_27]OGK72266.1 MAG: hypothetical protein A2313_03260 [Candidatus Roizmanbacteria bacterium RIFOXYB2_FULL_41_10]OGK72458.1 MAG: hypothetical protein A2403_03045 [Candidatus Roizmanbacteria bac
MAILKKDTPQLYSLIPKGSGVYGFLNERQKPIYIGKANDLRERIKQHFTDKVHPKEKLITENTHSIRLYETNSELAALILESNLIKQYQPKYNAVLLDDKSRLYIALSKGTYNKVLLVRKRDLKPTEFRFVFGPLSSMATAKLLLRKLRQAIPYCAEKRMGLRPCFYSHIGLCQPCPNSIAKLEKAAQTALRRQYQRNIRRLINVFKGRGRRILSELKTELKQLSQQENYEQALVLRDRINYLDTLFQRKLEYTDRLTEPNYIKELRIKESEALQTALGLIRLIRVECYDVSNLNFKEATASMVVFEKGEAVSEQYRRFKIKGRAIFDPEMLSEVLSRRFMHQEWAIPDLLVIDGGLPQLLKIKTLFKKQDSQNQPLIVGFAKRPDRLIVPKGNGLQTLNLDKFPEALNYLQRMRNEAHRFAKKYHLHLRQKQFKKLLNSVK